MYDWSHTSTRSPVQALEQAINFGLNGRKLKRQLLLANWEKLTLDAPRRKFLEILLWPKQTSLSGKARS